MRVSQLIKYTLMFTLAAQLTVVSCGDDDDDDDDRTVTLKGSSAQVSAGLTATSGINPSTVKIKVRRVAVSTDEYCGSLTTIYENLSPTYLDFSGTPDLGSGSLADGTYKCVVIEMSDQVQFTPSASSDNSACVSGTEYTLDVCQLRSGEDSTAKLVDGSTITCKSGEDYVGVFLSTASTNAPIDAGTTDTVEGNAFAAPTASKLTDGFKLQGDFVVAGDKNGTFYADFTGRVQEGSDSSGNVACDMDAPNWGFN